MKNRNHHKNVPSGSNKGVDLNKLGHSLMIFGWNKFTHAFYPNKIFYLMLLIAIFPIFIAVHAQGLNFIFLG